MIEVKDLLLTNESGLILDRVNLKALPSELTVILGPNGSGKTSILKCISGTWPYDDGQIILSGRNSGQLSIKERAKILAMVGQEHHPAFPYTVNEVVLMGRMPHVGLLFSPSRRDREIALSCIEKVKLGHLAGKPYTRISGGERQLVLIARGLAQQPKIILLDEPTAHLDFRNQIYVLRMIKELARKENLVALVTLHDPNLTAMFSDKVILLSKGRIVDEGNPMDVITPESLRQVYDLEVEWIGNNGRRFVYPRLDRLSV